MAKYKIIPSSRTIVQSPISIGHKAEKGVEAIEFDLTAWVETYGSGTLTVIMRRWGDAIPYPIALEIDENNKATWTLSDIDTAKAGMAYAQLSYIVGDEVVKKSDIYTFRVMDSLTGEGDPPEAYESWLEQLTHLAAEAMAEVLDIEGIVADKTLTVDGGIADAKATGDALSALEDQFSEETDKLKADLSDLTNAITVDLTNTLVNGYIDVGNVAIGGTVDNTVKSGGYKTRAIPCKQGDCFYVNGNGYSGNAPRIWAFTDTNYILISKAENRETLINAYLIAPSDGYAIFTFLVSAGDYSVKIIKPKTDTTLTEQGVPADSYTTGEAIDAINNAKQTVSFAYSNNLDWSITNGRCYLTVNDVTRIRFDTTNAAVDISKATFIAVASASTLVTVSGDTIFGTHFAVVFDFNTNTLKILDTSVRTTYINTSILFFYHYGIIGGQLVYNKTALDTYKNTNDIADIQAEIGNTLVDYFETEAQTCRNSLIADCGEKAFVIAFTTDNHYGASNGMNFPTTVKTIERVNELYQLDLVIDGGDLINGDETKTNAINRLTSAVNMLIETGRPAYTLLGNHDDDSFTATELPLFNKAELYAMLYRHEGINLDYIAESEQYGYKDFDQYGLRIIFLDALYGANGHVQSNWGYSDAELSWFTSDALNTSNQIVMFSHMAFTADYIAYGANIKNGVAMRTAVENFIANGGVVVGLFHGHNHWDYIGQYSQTNGFHEVSTGCSRIVSGPTISYAHPEGAVMPERTSDTVTQELWDIIIIKPESRTVNIIRFGAGNDRNFTY